MKAMRKVSRGAGFRGVLNYAFGRSKEERAAGAPPGRLLGGSMLGHDPRSLAAEFKLSREARQDIAKPVWHQALRLPPGEQITDDAWVRFADDYMRGMGFTDQHQRAYILHADEPALHIVASRIGLDGSLFLGKNENLQTTKLVAELEKKHGLQITVTADIDARTGLPSTKTDRRALKKGEVEKAIRTGFRPARLQIQEAVDEAIPTVASLDELLAALAKKGIETHIHAHPKTGVPRGISLECDGTRFSGSQLGENYKFQMLIERISHDHKNKIRPSARPADTAGDAHSDLASERVDSCIAENKKRVPIPRQTPGSDGSGFADHFADHRGNEETHPKTRAKAKSVAGRHPHPAENQRNQRSTEMTNMPNHTITPTPRVAYGSLAPALPGIIPPAPGGAAPPTLGGRLLPVQLSDRRGFELFWKDPPASRPTFRWQPQDRRLLILAQPTEKNVRALFDAAGEKGIGMPQIEITGSAEFQRLAAAEAARRGLPVDSSKLTDEAAREIYKQTWDQQHGDAANSIATAAYESDDREELEELRRIAVRVREREKNADRDGDGDRRPGDRIRG